MAQKQSKYSKRRPQGGIAYTEASAKLAEFDKKSKRHITYLEEYDLGIFIDDVRSMDKVELPKAKEWLVFKGYRELRDWISTLEERDSNAPLHQTAFISFDHYLDEVDRGRYNGNDCLNMCKLYKTDIARRVDIQGHSSDGVMNSTKLINWYDTKY